MCSWQQALGSPYLLGPLLPELYPSHTSAQPAAAQHRQQSPYRPSVQPLLVQCSSPAVLRTRSSLLPSQPGNGLTQQHHVGAEQGLAGTAPGGVAAANAGLLGALTQQLGAGLDPRLSQLQVRAFCE